MTQPPMAWGPPVADGPVDPGVQAPPVIQAVQNSHPQGSPIRSGQTTPTHEEPLGWASTLPQAPARSAAVPPEVPEAPATPVSGVGPASALPVSPGPQHAAPPSQPARPGQSAQPNPTAVEAPAPAPPARVEHGLPVTTTDSMPGRTITGVIGDVVGVYSRSRELAGNREIQARTLLTERQQAVTRMARMALGAHADAVVGMRFDTCQVSSDVIEVVAYGTAVRLAEAPGFSAPGIDLPRPSTGASATHPPTPPAV